MMKEICIIMTVTIIRCFEISTMLALQNIVCQMLIGRVEQNLTKLSKTIIDMPSFISFIICFDNSIDFLILKFLKNFIIILHHNSIIL